TVRFLVTSVINSESCTPSENGRGYIYSCKNLYVIAEEDANSPKKCRIIPIKDSQMLEEYNEEGNA
ncbi:MAG: hypothetical protein NC078_03815, partial [Ruminococcus sp.]|nr:hypothetical protein [Ruminococcus sp.]